MYVQFLDQNNPESEISARREILKPSKNLQSCIIRFKNYRLRLEFLNLIIHFCSFLKQYLTV